MKELKIGIYGLEGHQILGRLPKVHSARLSAVGGVTDEQAQKIREQHADVPIFADLDSMLEKGDADLISFCKTPRTEQTQLVLEALSAKKHVLVEKPIATTMGDLAKVREAVAASGTELRTMTNMPYLPVFTGMKKVVCGGDLGTVVQIYALKSYPYMDSRPQDRDVDGGIILQAAIHAVSFVRYVSGLDLVQVFAQDTGTGNPKPGDLQMGANMTFRMSNGGLAVVLANYCNPKSIGYHGNDQLRVHGTDGMIELVDGRRRRMLVLKGHEPCEFEDVEPESPYLQDLIDCILHGTPTVLSQEDSFRNTEIVLRAQESATQGVPLKI